MSKTWLRKLKEQFSNPRLRAATGLELGGSDTDATLRITAAAAKKNMQEDAAAFETWALAMRAAGASIITLSWEAGATHGPHGRRFLYRAQRFAQLCPWFRLAEELPPVLEPSDRRSFVLNVASIARRERVSSESFDVAASEREIETALAGHPTISEDFRKALGLDFVARQLPIGVFEGKVAKVNGVFTGGKSAIDLWGPRGGRLAIFELKNSGNVALGAVSELFFYAMVMRDLQRKLVAVHPPKEATENYDALRTTAGVDAYLLAPRFHPFLANGAILRILDEHAAPADVRFGLIRLAPAARFEPV
jgi:hypothetical protein